MKNSIDIVNIIIGLLLQASMPIALSVIFCLAERNKKFSQIKKWSKQILIGVCFGIAAIISTETGVNVGFALANVRDSAPLCAGLIFGAPAGIIAGVIGGVERWLCVLWGKGAYTRVACTLATLAAGIIAALLRKYMFEDKRPKWIVGLVWGSIVEVFHMDLVLITHVSNLTPAFEFVSNCALPIIFINSFAVSTALLLVSFIQRRDEKKTVAPISQTFQEALMLCVAGACVVTLVGISILNNRFAKTNIKKTFMTTISDVKQAVNDNMDESILAVAHSVSEEVENLIKKNPDSWSIMGKQFVAEYPEYYGCSEVSYIDSDGKVIYSSNDELVGFMIADEQWSSEFLPVCKGEQEEYIQALRLVSRVGGAKMKYAAVTLKTGGCMLCGYTEDDYNKNIAAELKTIINNRHLRDNGFILVLDENKNYLGISRGASPDKYDFAPVLEKKTEEFYDDGDLIFGMYSRTQGYYIICLMSQKEGLSTQKLSLCLTMFSEILMFSILFVLIYALLKLRVVNNIKRVNESLDKITAGDLDTRIDIRNSLEFDALSNGINQTVDSLKEYMDRETAMMENRNRELKEISEHDALTGIYNRHALNEIGAKWVEEAKADGGVMSVMILDIDCFKQYNDNYGHLEGDKALKAVADAMREAAGEHDFVARFGGDEFFVVTRDKKLSEVVDIAENIHRLIVEQNIPHETSKVEKYVTLTFGLAYGPVMEKEIFDDIIHRADDALYQIKNASKNALGISYEKDGVYEFEYHKFN